MHEQAAWLYDDRGARSAFYLGAVAPDARIVSGQRREETHFFDIPGAEGDPPAQEVMLARWPELRCRAAPSDRQRAALVAGYITHLVMDQTWVEMIVMPGLFIEGMTWNTNHPNWRVYSILMTYLEYRASQRLPREVLVELSSAAPAAGLPFLSLEHLLGWRDHVVHHIEAGGARQVSRLFARSSGLTTEALEGIVSSEEQMAREAYHLVPHRWLQAFEAEAADRSLRAVLRYLGDREV
ncbi:MAG: hypothetical protein Kow00124_19670 [Anaerolineae bacterium]